MRIEPLETVRGTAQADQKLKDYASAARALRQNVKFKKEVLKKEFRGGRWQYYYGIFIDDGPQVSSYSTSTPSASTS